MIIILPNSRSWNIVRYNINISMVLLLTKCTNNVNKKTKNIIYLNVLP